MSAPRLAGLAERTGELTAQPQLGVPRLANIEVCQGSDADLVLASIGVGMYAMPPIWPLSQLAMLAPAAIAIAFVPRLRPLTGWARGEVRLGLVLLVAVSSAAALVAWVLVAQPDLQRAMAMIPEAPLVLLVLGAVGFAIVNATLEELAFRGILQSSLAEATGSMPLAIVFQAVAFGLAHLHGVPNGWLGVAMAGTWALVLGWVRVRSRGLVTPILGHVVADLVIFALLSTG